MMFALYWVETVRGEIECEPATVPREVSSMAIMLGMLGIFFLGIIIVLYVTLKKSNSFDDYAVGGRSFGRGSWP